MAIKCQVTIGRFATAFHWLLWKGKFNSQNLVLQISTFWLNLFSISFGVLSFTTINMLSRGLKSDFFLNDMFNVHVITSARDGIFLKQLSLQQVAIY